MTEPPPPSPKARPLRRLLATAVAVALVAGGVWLAWSRAAARRLQARADGIVARHEPLYPRDFEAAPLPPAKNAAAYYQKAFSATSRTVWPPSGSMLLYKNYPPFPPAWHQLAARAVAANGPAMLLARQARPFDRADWGVSYPVFFNLLNPARALADVLADGALLAHFQGDDAEAVERVRDTFHLAAAMDAGPGGEVGHMIAAGYESLAEDRLEAMAPDLKIEEDAARAAPTTAATTAPTTGPTTRVSRATVLALIGEFLDDRRMLERRTHAVIVHRANTWSDCQRLRAGATLLRPMVDLETDRFLQQFTLLLRAVEQSDFAGSERVLSQWPTHRALPESSIRTTAAPAQNPEPPRYSHLLGSDLAGPPDRYVDIEWRWVAERHVAAADLAIQLYRADHHQFPPTLDALVPAYLPTVPADPFSPTRQPLGYVVLRGPSPGAADRPLLYFRIGAGAPLGSPPAEPCYGEPWALAGQTQWRDVSRWSAPQPPPATGP